MPLTFPTTPDPHNRQVGTPNRATPCRCEPAPWHDHDSCLRCGHYTAPTINHTWKERARELHGDDDDIPSTPTQRAYLDAFNDLLAAHSDNEYAAARAAMTQAFGPMLDQAGVTRDKSRPKRDLVELLVHYARNA